MNILKKGFKKSNIAIFFCFLFFVFSFNFVFSLISPSISLLDVTGKKIKEATLNASIDSLGDIKTIEWWFEYGTNDSNLSLKTVNTTDTVAKKVSRIITSLNSDTTYYYRFCGKDSLGISCTNINNFKTYSEPSVNIINASNVIDVSSKLNAVVNSLGTDSLNKGVQYWFEYGLGLEYFSKKTTPTKTLTIAGAISEDVIGLTPSSLYYYKACVKNEFSTICSSNISFNTSNLIPGPTTTLINAKTLTKDYLETSANSVQLYGRLDNLGNLKTLNYYFEYGENINFGNTLNENKNLTVVNDFSIELKNLAFDKTYYYRACVKDTVNVNNPASCGDSKFFTLRDYKNIALSVKSDLVSNLSDTTVKLNGSIEGFGGSDSVIVWFKINDGVSDRETNKINVTGITRRFSLTLDKLISGNNYKYVSCISNISKVVCEPNWNYFATLKNPTIKDSSVKNVTANSATFIGELVDGGISLNNIINGWFEYSIKSDLSSSVLKTTKKTLMNLTFEDNVSGLVKNTKYYYKFCVENGLTNVCSSIKDFIAANELKDPSVSLKNVIKTNDTSIKVIGYVDSIGGDDSAYTFLEWGELDTDLSNKIKEVQTNKIDVNFENIISNLVENKDYYYRICIRNSFSTKCSSLKKFQLFKELKKYSSDSLPSIDNNNKTVNLDEAFAKKMNGRILLQVEGKGEAWYINPINSSRYYLGRPADAFNIMKKVGLGITNITYKTLEVSKDPKFAGKILINVDDGGKAYYVNPTDMKMYFLGRPDDAFFIMKKLALGVTNSNLFKIPYYEFDSPVSINFIDSDSDNISDDNEINFYKTNPFSKDTDGDGYDDYSEIKNGYNPNGVGKLTT